MVWYRDFRDELDDFFCRLVVEAVAVLDDLERVTPFGNDDVRGELEDKSAAELDDKEVAEELGRGIVVEIGTLATRED